jgi:hypothetical protein
MAVTIANRENKLIRQAALLGPLDRLGFRPWNDETH